jgi:hypothetical protein
LLYDGKGALIKTQQTALLKGINYVEVNMSNLVNGTYTLVASWNNNTKIYKVKKQ